MYIRAGNVILLGTVVVIVFTTVGLPSSTDMEGKRFEQIPFRKPVKSRTVRIIGLPLMKLSRSSCFAVGIFHQENIYSNRLCGGYLATDRGGRNLRKKAPLVIQLVLLVSAY